MINTVKGFNVLVGKQIWKKELFINRLNYLAQSYGFTFLETPTVEKKTLYEKGVGLTSNIVQKEFFVTHSASTSCSSDLVLRPEFTSAVVRFFLKNKLFLQRKSFSFFSYGDCYRYEQPQKGRYRQFSQWNLETIDGDNLEQHFSFLATFLNFFQLKKRVIIETNYLGSKHFEKIKTFLETTKKQIKFCELCQKRWKIKNFYRILDCNICKIPLQKIWEKKFFWTAQEESDYLEIFQKMQLFFPNFIIKENPFLTRGLDYYQGFVFEIKLTDEKKTQNTIIAGGSYSLKAFFPEISQKKKTTDEALQTFLKTKKGFGFAIGVDRFLVLLNINVEGLNFFFPQIIIAYTLPSLRTASYFLQHQILTNPQFSSISPLIKNKINCWVNHQAKPFSKILIDALDHLPKLSSDIHFTFWLVILEKEYLTQDKYLCRQITNDPKLYKPLQLLLKKNEIIPFLFKKLSL